MKLRQRTTRIFVPDGNAVLAKGAGGGVDKLKTAARQKLGIKPGVN